MAERWQTKAELLGLTNEAGEVARPLLPGTVLRPCHVAIEGDQLVWYADVNPRESPPRPVFVRADGPLLDQFVRLANAPAQSVVAFARRWGALDRYEDRVTEGEHAFSGAEPLALWYALARQAAAILLVAGHLHQGEQAPLAAWRDVLTVGVLPLSAAETFAAWESGEWQRYLWGECAILGVTIDAWIDTGDVRPHLVWNADKPPEIVLQGTGLLGALAVQLLGAVSRTEGIAVCSACGATYTPKRRPRAGERRYCAHCGKRAARRDAARDYRQRQQQTVRAPLAVPRLRLDD